MEPDEIESERKVMRKGVCSIAQGTSMMIVVLLLALPLQGAEFVGGTGEPNDPYQIATAEQLVSIGSDPNRLDKHFILVADIDLSPHLPGGRIFEGAVIAPDSESSENVFSGVFDGNGHTISNLTMEGGKYLGLLGRLSGCVRSVALIDARIASSGFYVGAIAGFNEGTVIHCACTGEVVADSSAGGLVGVNSNGRVIHCHSDVTVTAENSVAGGLIGRNSGGCVVASYSMGSVCGLSIAGGLIGECSDGTVTQCFSRGNVCASGRAGGLIGQILGGFVVHCYSIGAVIGQRSSIGGLIGTGRLSDPSRGCVSGCFWDWVNSGQFESFGGVGKTSLEMQSIETFLAAGWDFAGEKENGVCDYWEISSDQYPRLRADAVRMPKGSGTEADPYTIRDACDLGAIWFQPMACYRLETSLDLSGISWSITPVPWFEGTFDGNGCVIGNLHIEGSGDLGLFGQTGPSAVIFRLGLYAASVEDAGGCAGILAGVHGGQIGESYTSGMVRGNGTSGGLVGVNQGRIESSYSHGSASGSRIVGGLVGSNWGDIAVSYSSSAVIGEGSVGGVVGTGTVGLVTSSFWDVETSSVMTGLAGTGKTTTEMQMAATFVDAGWDFESTWMICEGKDYPRLQWEGVSCE